jgi:uncharacterized protein
MKCPTCQVDLVMTERQGVEIDYCPKCRGVWLDRGELDKIIEKSAQMQGAPQYAGAAHDPTWQRPGPYRGGEGGDGERGYGGERGHGEGGDGEGGDYGERGYRGRRRNSFLGDIFDF